MNNIISKHFTKHKITVENKKFPKFLRQKKRKREMKDEFKYRNKKRNNETKEKQ